MAEGAIDTYMKTAYDHFKIQPTWPPGSLVDVGWVGKMKDGQFVRTSELADHGIRIRRKTVEVPAMRFASAGGVEFIASAKGSLSKAVSAIAKADAGLKIAFKKNAAIAIVLDPVVEIMIDNVDAVLKWMDEAGRKKLDQDHVVVTHVRRARAGVIAMAQSAGAEVQLKTDVSLGRGSVELGKVRGKFSLVTSSSTDFVSIPSGRSGLSPFYRFLHYKDVRDFLEKLLGLSKKPSVELARKRLAYSVSRNVMAFPYDKEFLETR